MAAVGEKYRLKKIRNNEWYEITRVGPVAVVAKNPAGNEMIISLKTLERDYTKEK